VTGQRADGYHLLDSIVAFARLTGRADGLAGDSLSIRFGDVEGSGPRLTVDGPFAAAVPCGEGNSVLAAAQAVGGIAAIHLTKVLPVAAGIGGGSADAAAVLSAAADHRGIPRETLADLALPLGADVPVCLAGHPARMRGIGEMLTPLALPSIPCLLVNPGVSVSTPAVFAALAAKSNPPLSASPPPAEPGALLAYLEAARNDLEPPAVRLEPAIGAALARLAGTDGCALARMSGSGGTVFGLYADDGARDAAAAALGAHVARLGLPWWIAPAVLDASPGAQPS